MKKFFSKKNNPPKKKITFKGRTLQYSGDSFRAPLVISMSGGAVLVWLGIMSALEMLKMFFDPSTDPTSIPPLLMLCFYLPWWCIWFFAIGIWLWTFAGTEGLTFDTSGIEIWSKTLFFKKRHRFALSDIDTVERYDESGNSGSMMAGFYRLWRGKITLVMESGSEYYFGTGLCEDDANAIVRHARIIIPSGSRISRKKKR